MRKAYAQDRVTRLYNALAKHYDALHGFLTAHSDERGRRMVVGKTVRTGQHVLDTGAGTGSTALLAARRAGPKGKVVLLDASEGMLKEAREKAEQVGLADRMRFEIGDMQSLPFADNTFDCVLSTYSVCPLGDPSRGALEAYRVLRPGGRAGFAHSIEPRNRIVRYLADKIESIAWLVPFISMGCRAVDVLPALKNAGAQLRARKRIGVPLWPFQVFVVEKPLPEES